MFVTKDQIDIFFLNHVKTGDVLKRVKKQIFQITVGISLWGKQVNSKYTHISIIGSLLCTMRLQSLLFFLMRNYNLRSWKYYLQH